MIFTYLYDSLFCRLLVPPVLILSLVFLFTKHFSISPLVHGVHVGGGIVLDPVEVVVDG
jgi:hypothetical protein